MNINIATRLRMIDVVLFVVLALMLAAITVSAQQTDTSNKAHKRNRSTASRAEKESPSATVTVLRNGKRVKIGVNPETERFDEPDAAMNAYVEKRLPKGMKQLPLERYF